MVGMFFCLLAWEHPAAAKIVIQDLSGLDPAVLKIQEDPFLGTRVPDIVFRDEEGRASTLQFLGGKPLILVLVFYECTTICTVLADGLSEALQGVRDLRAGRDFNVLVLSFNDMDTPESARKYRELLQGRVGQENMESWIFATAVEDEITKLTKALGYPVVFVQKDQVFIHPPVFIFLSPTRQVVRYLKEARPQAADVRLALLEATDHKIRKLPLTTIVTLFFHRYDAHNGRYEVDQVKVMAMTFGISLAVAVPCILRMGRRRRQKP